MYLGAGAGFSILLSSHTELPVRERSASFPFAAFFLPLSISIFSCPRNPNLVFAHPSSLPVVLHTQAWVTREHRHTYTVDIYTHILREREREREIYIYASTSLSIHPNLLAAGCTQHFMMTIRAAKFTPEVLLSAPRRSPGSPNSTGKLVLHTVSPHAYLPTARQP